MLKNDMNVSDRGREERSALGRDSQGGLPGGMGLQGGSWGWVGAPHSTPSSQPTTRLSRLRQTWFLTLPRSHHQEEREGWAHGEKPVRQPVDSQQTPPHHFCTHAHHRLEAAHAQGSGVYGQGERQLQRQPLTGPR